jgi:hypothetical protein
LYVLAVNATSIEASELSGAGDAKKIQTLDFAAPIRRAGLSINTPNLQGMAVYVK